MAIALRTTPGLQALILFGSRAREDAFRKLEAAGVVDGALTDRLVRAAGFRNVVAHAYESLDLTRVHAAATRGPADLRAFLARLRDRIAR